MDHLSPIANRDFSQFLDDAVTQRLKQALNRRNDKVAVATSEVVEVETAEDNRIVTTEEELQAYYIVKSILAKRISLSRITSRDTQSYFGVLLNDNNRKPICRFHFNGGRKYVETFDFDKKGTKHQVDRVEDVYNLSEQLLFVIDFYEN